MSGCSLHALAHQFDCCASFPTCTVGLPAHERILAYGYGHHQTG